MAPQAVAVERRKLSRYIPEIDAFVSLKNCGVPPMCKLLDISLKGLAFSCIPCRSLLSDLSKLSIVIPHPIFYLRNVSFGLISDSEIDIGSVNGFATRRCGVRFVDLNPNQNASLTCLIETLSSLRWGFSFADRNIGFQRPHERACSTCFISLKPSLPPNTEAQTDTA
jgi:hypothetical protein